MHTNIVDKKDSDVVVVNNHTDTRDKYILKKAPRRPPYPAARGRHLQAALASFFDADSITEGGEDGAKRRAQAPVVEVAEVTLEGRIDQPLFVLLRHSGRAGSVRRVWSSRGTGVHRS